MEQRHEWDDHTLKLVRTLWGFLIATIMISGALFFVLPELINDNDFSRYDLGAVFGVILIGVAVALPSLAMELLGRAVVAIKTWRGNSK